MQAVQRILQSPIGQVRWHYGSPNLTVISKDGEYFLKLREGTASVSNTEINRVVKLCGMRLASPLIKEDNETYYRLEARV